ncbi:BTAD domain-containing putative transcriptional regulator [Kitasatospora sp. NPDC036755]|uniref:AfsR/SARP family transcriptional regulator n=1 Tax=Kitasatospora sp. NPDC036755 TaxID=3154600 RepID=UPI0033E34AAC
MNSQEDVLLDFRMLGPVEVHHNGTAVDLGPPKRRTVLAVLALAHGSLVTVDRLTDALWHERPPTHAKTTIQGHVSRLRRLVHPTGGATIETVGDGYLLHAPTEGIDVRRFRDAVSASRRDHTLQAPAAPDSAVPTLRRALALWRGPALTGLCDTPLITSAAAELEESRLSAVENLGHALTCEHRAEDAVAVLRGPVDRHPLRESLVAALLDALLAADRQAAAIRLYHRTARLLADELGVSPGPALARSYARILAGPQPGEHTLPAPRTQPSPRSSPRSLSRPADLPEAVLPETAHPEAARPVADGVRRPFLLPRRPAGFRGREHELDRLDEAVAPTRDAPVCLVTGPAGIGKSALVAHWAQRAATAFPDGVLFARLDGFVGTAPAADPAFVLRDFLVALGTRPDDLPHSPAAAESRYRELLRDRRVLVLLDDALSYDQVRPLLPDAAGCASVVTSRNRLESLIAADCARPLLLDRLEPRQGAALLADVLGPERVEAEPSAVRRLVWLCDGLPLALRLTGARLATRPERSLREAAEEMRDERQRLALLAAGEFDLASVLRASVGQLPPEAAELLHLLAHHAGPDADLGAVTALAGGDPAAVRAALNRLITANLLEERAQGRYALRDLVRLFARTLGPAPDPDRLLRLLDHYLCGALAAAAVAGPGGGLPEDVRPPAGAPAFADRAEAMAWYARERRNLVAAVAAAAAAGHHGRVWRLAALLWPLVIQQTKGEWAAPLGHALASAVQLALLGHHGEARWYFDRAGRLAGQDGPAADATDASGPTERPGGTARSLGEARFCS